MTLGATQDDRAITSLSIEVLGITQESGNEDVALSRLVQIARAMTGEPLMIPALIRLLEWSADGRGGKQREWVRAALDGATAEKPIICNLGGDQYRRLWIARVKGHEHVFCQSIDPADAREAAAIATAGVDAEVSAALRM
jgi:hypothetical protein